MSVRTEDVVSTSSQWAPVVATFTAAGSNVGNRVPEAATAPQPVTQLDRLVTLTLVRALSVVVEPDERAFVARCPELPQLYGYGDAVAEAVESLQREIESLWEDLQEDDGEFSDEFLQIKALLQKHVKG